MVSTEENGELSGAAAELKPTRRSRRGGDLEWGPFGPRTVSRAQYEASLAALTGRTENAPAADPDVVEGRGVPFDEQDLKDLSDIVATYVSEGVTVASEAAEKTFAHAKSWFPSHSEPEIKAAILSIALAQGLSDDTPDPFEDPQVIDAIAKMAHGFVEAGVVWGPELVEKVYERVKPLLPDSPELTVKESIKRTIDDHLPIRLLRERSHEPFNQRGFDPEDLKDFAELAHGYLRKGVKVGADLIQAVYDHVKSYFPNHSEDEVKAEIGRLIESFVFASAKDERRTPLSEMDFAELRNILEVQIPMHVDIARAQRESAATGSKVAKDEIKDGEFVNRSPGRRLDSRIMKVMQEVRTSPSWRQTLKVGLAVLGVLAFAWFIWPTPYVVSNYEGTIKRVNRFTGRVETATTDGWYRPPPFVATAPEPKVPMPPPDPMSGFKVDSGPDIMKEGGGLVRLKNGSNKTFDNGVRVDTSALDLNGVLLFSCSDKYLGLIKPGDTVEVEISGTGNNWNRALTMRVDSVTAVTY